MKIGKLIKTGLAIYGGYTLANKAGVYLYKKYKDKIVEKVRSKILELSNKAIDEIFHTEEKEASYHFDPNDIRFSTYDNAFDARQSMIDRIHDLGNATVFDLKDLAGLFCEPMDIEYGWKDPDIFEAASVERIRKSGMYMYVIDCAYPEKLCKED